MSGTKRPSQVVYPAACSDCGAGIGSPCKTGAGNSLHPQHMHRPRRSAIFKARMKR